MLNTYIFYYDKSFSFRVKCFFYSSIKNLAKTLFYYKSFAKQLIPFTRCF